ncbi:MAG: biotin--[acetyl-CoA-carboxylase] ligase [Acidimicrobiia bacterium]|nr:biotin--[acetyl-CoA-carboxylase] ligase [Acidimicrobiia bacterium]
MDTPYALVSFEETASTQDDARRRFEGTPVLVVARRQTAGRGRGGSSWETAPRAVAVSLAVATDWPPEAWGRIPLIAGLSALECLPDGPKLKWPNDVVAGGRKLAGILVEGFENFVVAGLGINLWWNDPPVDYGAVFESDPGETAHLEIARQWGAALLRRLSTSPDAWDRDEYVRACVTLGRTIRWQPDGSGVAEGIAGDGALLVRTADGVERITGGEVFEIRNLEADSEPIDEQ